MRIWSCNWFCIETGFVLFVYLDKSTWLGYYALSHRTFGESKISKKFELVVVWLKRFRWICSYLKSSKQKGIFGLMVVKVNLQEEAKVIVFLEDINIYDKLMGGEVCFIWLSIQFLIDRVEIRVTGYHRILFYY